MKNKTEYTVTGFDILNLVANIDERQDEIKAVSDNWEKEHPKPKEPDYKNKSIFIINKVIMNILEGRREEEPIFETITQSKNMVEITPLKYQPEYINNTNQLINFVVQKIIKGFI